MTPFAFTPAGSSVGRVSIDLSDLSDLTDVAAEPAQLAEALLAQIEQAFVEHGWTRVESHVAGRDVAAQRVAQRAGLRREGRLRAAAADGVDDVLVYARLVSDPAPDSGDGFTGILDSIMPLKRNIAQGVVWDEQGRVLLCETTYKRDWDLPGGIVDPDEPPSTTVERELREELGADLVAGELLTVAWLPRYKGWSDATLFVFDLGSRSALPAHLVLQPREIRAVHWADRATVAQRCAPYAARLLHLLMDRRDAGLTGTVYVVDGEPRQS